MTKESENNQKDQPTEEQQPSDEAQSELREISEEELKQILEDHKKWLESDRKEGKKADLSKANLKKIRLNGTNLQEANLEKANLKWAIMYGANLQEANLDKANLQEANLGQANLKFASLVEAYLQKARLGGADLQGAVLARTNMETAFLGGANLQKAIIEEANLKWSNLNKANLQQANLRKAKLQFAKLRKANLQKANLGEANLHFADLGKANLQYANLWKANLKEGKLGGANLQEAIIAEASLQQADLSKAIMQNTVLDGVRGLSEANIKYANLKDATGLLGNEFAQADVTGTKLPDDIKEFKSLEVVKETSQNARKIFFAMLLGCVYSWLTIATTTDINLLTNTASSPLPIIGTEIPIVWFYIVAPLVLICLYFYFHLYLDNLWKGLARLPAIFPDGKPLDQTAYPWLLISLVNRHSRVVKKRAELEDGVIGKPLGSGKLLKRYMLQKNKIVEPSILTQKELSVRPSIFYMKEWITIFLAWWVVPLTMIAFWLRYISRHEWLGTCVHIVLILVSVAFAIIFYRLCSLTLRGKKEIKYLYHYFRKGRRSLYVSVCLCLILLLYTVFAFNFLGADFAENTVSVIPTNYWEISRENQLKSVKGANLRGHNLKKANMYKSFLVKADLRNALLESANLGETNLQQANLDGANLQQANLRGANLQNAYLGSANLKQAYLGQANLHGASFLFANLDSTNLRRAENLTINQLSKVKTLYKCNLDHELFKEVLKCYPHLLEKPKEEVDKKDSTE